MVILVGFRWGLDALYLAHTYLGYALFLAVACGFWYAALTWNKRLSSATKLTNQNKAGDPRSGQ